LEKSIKKTKTMDINKISKKEFDQAYNTYPETKFIKWVYKFYNFNLKEKPKPIGTWLAIIFWCLATLGLVVFTEIGMAKFARVFLWLYIPFGSLIITLPTFLLNKKRIKKIVKLLGINTEEYNYLVNKFYSS